MPLAGLVLNRVTADAAATAEPRPGAAGGRAAGRPGPRRSTIRRTRRRRGCCGCTPSGRAAGPGSCGWRGRFAAAHPAVATAAYRRWPVTCTTSMGCAGSASCWRALAGPPAPAPDRLGLVSAGTTATRAAGLSTRRPPATPCCSPTPRSPCRRPAGRRPRAPGGRRARCRSGWAVSGNAARSQRWASARGFDAAGVVGLRGLEQPAPGRHVGPAAQQRTALALGHAAPDTPLDLVVQRLGEALGTDRAAPCRPAWRGAAPHHGRTARRAGSRGRRPRRPSRRSMRHVVLLVPVVAAAYRAPRYRIRCRVSGLSLEDGTENDPPAASEPNGWFV